MRDHHPIPSAAALRIETLGSPRYASPLLTARPALRDELSPVLAVSTLGEAAAAAREVGALPAFEAAGPRSRLFFDPTRVRAAIVTCGGLCPGLNNVIRSIVMALHHGYGCRSIHGYRYGYAGIADRATDPPMPLTPENTKLIHQRGGTILGASRGPRDIGEMVDALVDDGVDVLFTIGGDGTLRGAAQLSEEIRRRRLEIAVVGVPKTIDNDLRWIERSFGFATAVEEAERAIDAAHVEARGARGGVGLVKLMGRNAGFIAAHASLSSSDVNFCLIPEVEFELEGARGLLELLRDRLENRGHAVVVVAEGAGQQLLDAPEKGFDASGNAKLQDIAGLVRRRTRSHLESLGVQASIKLIDPSYIIRSRPANSIDSELCLVLGQHAVHAAMAGRTGLMIGQWNQAYIHVPIALAVEPSRIDPRGEVWMRVLEATGQPAEMR